MCNGVQWREQTGQEVLSKTSILKFLPLKSCQYTVIILSTCMNKIFRREKHFANHRICHFLQSRPNKSLATKSLFQTVCAFAEKLHKYENVISHNLTLPFDRAVVKAIRLCVGAAGSIESITSNCDVSRRVALACMRNDNVLHTLSVRLWHQQKLI